jgi:NADH-ubiquinone oxidoreductase chain 6
MLIFITSLITATYIRIIIVSSPVQITLIIILIALLTAALFSNLISSWYAFLLFLIYVGGILVIFAYFTATSPNQQITNIKKVIVAILVRFSFSLITIYRLDFFQSINYRSYQIISIFSSNNSYLLIGITIILLLTIIIVVKLASRSKGPLRSFIN